MKNDNLNRSKSMKKFLICSILGFICFLMPIPDSGSWNIPINYVTTRLEGLVGNAGLTILFVEFVIALLGSVIVTLFLKDKFTKDTFIGKIFNCGPVDLTCRILGSLLFFMYYFKIGPDLFLGPDVGGSLEGLLLTVGVGLGLALILMPLLTDFGLMEFLGTLFNGGMRKIWKLPGRAAVDLLSSWFGMVQVGLLISEKVSEWFLHKKRSIDNRHVFHCYRCRLLDRVRAGDRLGGLYSSVLWRNYFSRIRIRCSNGKNTASEHHA